MIMSFENESDSGRQRVIGGENKNEGNEVKGHLIADEI